AAGMAHGRDAHARDYHGVRPRSRRLRGDCAAANARSHLRARRARPLSGLHTGEPRRGCARYAGGQRQQGHPRDARQALSRARGVTAEMKRGETEIAAYRWRDPGLLRRTARHSGPSLITSATLLSLGSTITICCAVRKNLWAFTCGTFWLTSLGIGRGLMPGGIGSPIVA